jgi:hypothetical protein
MEADGVGLRRAASNDDKAGGWDETWGREGGSLGRKLTKEEYGRLYSDLIWVTEPWIDPLNLSEKADI